jgi:hypothetical protein
MKQITLTAALGLFGMLMLGTSAHAQVTTFDVSNPNPGEGEWHVVVTQTGDAFSVNVSADTGLLKPASDADEITVKVLDTALNPMSAINNGGGVVGKGTGPWTNIANGDTMDWKWTNALYPPVFALDDGGANYFLGSFTITPLPGEIQQWVDVTVYDSINGPWTETEQLAPEASSLALLLPGLIPLGIALRRRRKTRD